MFQAYGALWITEEVFREKYSFNTLITEYNYQIPDYTEHSKYLEHINTLPEKDNPLIFGLNSNADLTYRLKESNEMINVLVETMPKESSSASGRSLEDEVKDKLQTELIKMLPADFLEIEVDEKLKTLKGPRGLTDVGKNIPLNVFLFQEIQRLQRVLDIVRTTMQDMVLAIDGQIIMTAELVDCINAVSDFRVPKKFQFDPTGVEISWLTMSLAGWLKGLIDRHHQLNNWLTSPNRERPPSFWLTGFFNPQGFLTSMKQEVTRQHRADQWSLDEVDYKTEVTKDIIAGDDGRIEGKQIKSVDEGVLIHGLYLEGSQWNKTDKRFEEQTSKDLFFPFPIIHVSAESTSKEVLEAQKKKGDTGNRANQYYFTPVYKYPKRNDRYLIFRAYLKAEAPAGQLKLSQGVTPVMNWKLKGVCLLCCKE
jgi:dynein heavy chain